LRLNSVLLKHDFLYFFKREFKNQNSSFIKLMRLNLVTKEVRQVKQCFQTKGWKSLAKQQVSQDLMKMVFFTETGFFLHPEFNTNFGNQVLLYKENNGGSPRIYDDVTNAKREA
jgi:hypothetical protein